MVDIYFTYGMTYGNAQAARRIYQAQYPQQFFSHVYNFSNIYWQFKKTTDMQSGYTWTYFE